MKGHFTIHRISTLSLWVSAVLAAIFIAMSIYGFNRFNAMQNYTSDYIISESAARQLKDASILLTEQARLYATNGNREHMELYFEEAQVTMQREKAVEQLQQHFDDTAAFQNLQAALRESIRLMDTEYHSMRLVAEAQGENISTLPAAVRLVQLPPEEAALSPEAKMQLAQQLVSDPLYHSSRQEIFANVSACLDDLIKMTLSRRMEATETFRTIFLQLTVGICVLALIYLFNNLMNYRCVARFIENYRQSVHEGGLLPLSGADELQEIAQAYNKLYEENQETQNIIRHQADTDPLTGTLTRHYFDHILAIYETGSVDFALAVVKGENLQQIEEEQGKAVRDSLWKQTASLLQQSFRNTDYICCLDEDLFAVVMLDITREKQALVKSRFFALADALAESDKPRLHCTVGIAFSQPENPPGEILQKVQEALEFTGQQGEADTGAIRMKL